MRTRNTSTLVAALATAAALAAGCQSPSSTTGQERSSLERRAAMIRGAAESQWEAVGLALERGEPVNAEYVHTLAEFRYAAMAIELNTNMLSDSPRERAEAEEVIALAEKALPLLLAAPMDEPPSAGARAPDLD